MFGLIPSVHDGGRWLQKTVMPQLLPDTRLEDGDALVVVAVLLGCMRGLRKFQRVIVDEVQPAA